MLIKIVYPLLFAALSFSLSAQKIEVLDDREQPLPSAHVTFTSLNGDQQKTTLTDPDGFAIVPVGFSSSEAPFAIKVSYLGFHPVTDTVQPGANRQYSLKPDQVSLNQMVVTAQYAPSNPEKAVHKVRVIDRKRIEAQGAVTLRDVLWNENNIRLSQDNILGSSMSMQGISGQNVKILIDGVPVVGRLNGNVDISQVNLNNIERIEMVEGPLSVNYGTDALAGTVNLITKKDQQKRFDVGLNNYYESVGQYNIDGHFGWRFNKSRLSVSGGRNYFDGWSPTDAFFRFPKSRRADTNRVQQWNPKEQYFGKVQYSLNRRKLTIRPYAEYFTETITNRGFPREPYYEVAFDDYYHTRRTNGGIDVSGEIAENKNIKVLAAYNNFERIKNTYRKDLTTLQQGITENPGDQDTSKFNLWMSRGSFSTSHDSNAVNYEIGYDINYETAYGQRIEGTENQQGDYALFGSVEWNPVDGLVMRPGVRYSYNTAYKAPVVPSVNLRYSPASRHNQKWTYRFSYSRGFRAPSLKELYFDFVDVNHNIVGNLDLRAEQSNNYQLNVTWQRVESQSIQKIEAGAYHNHIRNQITLAQSPGNAQFTYVNIGEHKTLGFQAGGELAWEHLKLTLGGVYVGRYNAVSDSLPVAPFSYTPEVRSNMIYEFHELQANVAAFYKYTGPLPGFSTDVNDEVTQTTISGYHMLDVTFTKYFWQKKLQWSVGGKNLLDVQNINATASSGDVHAPGGGAVPVSWGRSVFTKLTLNLGF